MRMRPAEPPLLQSNFTKSIVPSPKHGKHVSALGPNNRVICPGVSKKLDKVKKAGAIPISGHLPTIFVVQIA